LGGGCFSHIFVVVVVVFGGVEGRTISPRVLFAHMELFLTKILTHCCTFNNMDWMYFQKYGLVCLEDISLISFLFSSDVVVKEVVWNSLVSFSVSLFFFLGDRVCNYGAWGVFLSLASYWIWSFASVADSLFVKEVFWTAAQKR